MKFGNALVVLGLLGGCAADAGSEDQISEVARVEAAITGQWDFQRIWVEFVDEDMQPFSEPAMVYPDRETKVTMLNTDAHPMVRMTGHSEFLPGGVFKHNHEISIDGKVDDAVEFVGTWEIDEDGMVVTDVPGKLHTIAALAYDKDGTLRLDYDRSHIEFKDSSCVISLYLSPSK